MRHNPKAGAAQLLNLLCISRDLGTALTERVEESNDQYSELNNYPFLQKSV